MPQADAAVRAGTPGVVDPARISAEISAAMHGKQLQVRMAFKYPIEDEIMKRKSCFEGIADHVIEIVAGETPAFGEAIRMNDDERPKLLGLFPERRVLRRRKFGSGDISEHLGALHVPGYSSTVQARQRPRDRPSSARSQARRNDQAARATYWAIPSLTIRVALTAMSSGTV